MSAVLGRAVSDVDIVEVLLSRTSFGTSALWRDAGAVALVNLLLLADVVGAADPRAPLADFAMRAERRLDEIVGVAQPRWVEREIDLKLAELRLPILEYDAAELGRARADAWQGVATLHG